ncbi:hypothetical protein LSTR_LSTR009309 [Laodelphax striatellus]|uniref:WD repeat-containing protein on Y chromosome n=1 Tax=Laodelphax striatellus TaxID=195883 RepID=A0A482XSY2_LAOST|nr:hypothetical protein LSTR_LSTR009309 [Laodelphax striatellus]
MDTKELLEENEAIMLADHDQANDDNFNGQASSIRLFDKLTLEDLTNLKERFKSTKSGCLSKKDLQNIFSEICPNLFDEEEFHCFYLKLNFKQTGKADWDEFLTYLMMEFEEKAKTTTKVPELVELPIVTPVKFIKSFHRHPIIRMTYCPTLDTDRKFNYQNGRYLTCSKDGFINYWNLDMVNEKTCYAKLPQSKMAANARVLDMVCMPDVNVVGVCSILRDLRFYDTAARKFELRVLVTDITWPITCLNYAFSQNIDEDSKLIMGDTAGSVFIMVFNSRERGPFTQKPGIDVTSMKFEAIVKDFQMLQFVHIHSDSVCQVQLNATNTFFSCATTPEASLLLCDVTRVRKPYVFNVPGLGVSCFAYDEDTHLLVTGGGDGLLRLWNPYVPQKNSGTCKKHDAKVCAITIQNDHHLIYSISKDRCLKVWDSRTKRCIRILTVSKDSTIIAWEPFIGRCLFTINHAHTRMELGESKDLPITTAEFDPSKVLLITGSNDGSMKVRVVDIHWISNRILVMTWRHILEFVYPEGTIVGKTWETKHTDDLTACAVCHPHAFVTATFNAQLIFWRLETGQSLKGFVVVDPEKGEK